MTGSSTFDKVVFAVALVILIPVLLTPAGWLFGVTLAALWIVGAYGGRYLLGVEKQRRTGERGRIAQVRADARDRGGKR